MPACADHALLARVTRLVRDQRARAERSDAAALENALHTGFQTAASCGPLCEEPMWGVAFIVDAIESTPAGGGAASASAAGAADAGEPVSARSGAFMACVKDAMRTAMRRGSPRLVEAMLRCQVQCTMEQLGNMHGVISKRRGQVLREDLWEGTYVFTVECLMPVRVAGRRPVLAYARPTHTTRRGGGRQVAESFGFAEELRVKTSGAAGNPQMMLAHWQALDMDPFFQPRTEDEREEHGEQVRRARGAGWQGAPTWVTLPRRCTRSTWRRSTSTPCASARGL